MNKEPLSAANFVGKYAKRNTLKRKPPREKELSKVRIPAWKQADCRIEELTPSRKFDQGDWW